MAQMICPNCGKELPETVRECPFCGLSISSPDKSRKKTRKIRISGIIGVIIWTLGILGSYEETIGNTEPVLSIVTFLIGAALSYFAGCFIGRIIKSRNKFKIKIKPQSARFTVSMPDDDMAFGNTESNDSQSTDKPYDKMDGHEFEHYCARLLEKNGYQDVSVTQGSGDFGIDILAQKEGITYAIQCKCYSSNIGNKAVQEAYSGKDYYKCMVGVVLTNQFFTPAAQKTAAENRVLLWDRTKLEELIENSK